MRVCPLQEAGLAKLSMQDIQRFGLVQEIPGRLPSIRILLDICAHHQPDRPTGRQTRSWIRIQKQPIYLPPPPMSL